MTGKFRVYDRSRSYEWNYDNAPEIPKHFAISPSARKYQLCGLVANSPISIAAGPLLNGRWILHYAAAGYDVLTYKTVRSKAWPCYGLPNLQPIAAGAVKSNTGEPLNATDEMIGSWAVSFGMPSKSPEVWRRDIEQTRRLLPREKLLSVSCVATPEPNWSLEEIADDYSKCAVMAAESGADLVELNFSCPNVSTNDGQLYQHPDNAARVANCVRDAVPKTPLLIKIGHVTDRAVATQLVSRLGPLVNGLVMVNCIGRRVATTDSLLFQGQRRGIAGRAILDAALDQMRLFCSLRTDEANLDLIGVGGISSPADVDAQLSLGADGVQIATAAMHVDCALRLPHAT